MRISSFNLPDSDTADIAAFVSVGLADAFVAVSIEFEPPTPFGPPRDRVA
jgi:hypothetical protein